MGHSPEGGDSGRSSPQGNPKVTHHRTGHAAPADSWPPEWNHPLRGTPLPIKGGAMATEPPGPSVVVAVAVSLCHRAEWEIHMVRNAGNKPCTTAQFEKSATQEELPPTSRIPHARHRHPPIRSRRLVAGNLSLVLLSMHTQEWVILHTSHQVPLPRFPDEPPKSRSAPRSQA